MLLVIGDQKYDMHETLSKPSLNDLYYLKVKTRSEEFPAGVSLKSLAQNMQRMGDVIEAEGTTGLLDDAEMLLSLRALIFLCRKHAGETVTLDSANDFPLNEFRFEAEESDSSVVGVDPLEPRADSVRGDGNPPRARSTKSRRTSNATSPKTS